MATERLRTVSIDLPDDLVRRIARHVGRNGKGGFSSIVEQALETWAQAEDERDRSHNECGLVNIEQTGSLRREIV